MWWLLTYLLVLIQSGIVGNFRLVKSMFMCTRRALAATFARRFMKTLFTNAVTGNRTRMALIYTVEN